MLKSNCFKTRLIVALGMLFVSGLSHAADTNKGAQLYTTHCAACHGISGESVMIGAPNFSQREGMMNSDATLLISIQSGKAAMPAYRGVLSDQDILNVIAFLRTLN